MAATSRPRAKKAAAGDRDMSGQHAWDQAARAPVGARGLAARELHPWERRRGARLLASVATDVDDVQLLLDATGLTAADGLATTVDRPFTTPHTKDS